MANECGNTSLFMPDFFSDYYPRPWLSICGQGECTDQGVCECDPHWTGKADFLWTEGIECQVNNIAIKILWAFNLIVLIGNIISVKDDVILKRRQHHEVVQQKGLQGKKYTMWDNKGYAAIIVWLALCAPGTFILGIIKISTNSYRLGHSWAMNFLFFVAKTGFYFGTYMYQPQLLATILKGSRSQIRIVELARAWGLFNFILSEIVAFLPFLTSATTSTGIDHAAQAVYLTYMVGSVLSMFTVGLQGLVITLKFKKIMSGSLTTKSKSAAEEIQKKLYGVQRQTYLQASVQGFIYLCFIFIPSLWNKHDWFLPISWLSFHALFRIMAKSTITTKRLGTSSMDSSNEGSKESSFSSSKRVDASSFVVSRNPQSTQPLTDFHDFQEKASSFHEVVEHKGREEDDYV
mmetsp:Transcript_853/g.1950  ORF Transcript_853/g.1950 Transcript_853/m.1950 type:complete len:405 (+) Transcript_853:885-2099(+)|eukprot:CAMPEP_0171489340 /NCGR_PEP_ID=MMETSP0958-20121227/2705_1 /TAXON_ID=87120 /ORGANISM="Aurantiochytrium limacinum, Strain ATCCMYA-1381" /LENGTH=404 /DNA_ID=CAMNT_0012022547 /DNA_START=817 /DNA_END=2031 /DNA_ORIENTATION=+